MPPGISFPRSPYRLPGHPTPPTHFSAAMGLNTRAGTPQGIPNPLQPGGVLYPPDLRGLQNHLTTPSKPRSNPAPSQQQAALHSPKQQQQSSPKQFPSDASLHQQLQQQRNPFLHTAAPPQQHAPTQHKQESRKINEQPIDLVEQHFQKSGEIQESDVILKRVLYLSLTWLFNCLCSRAIES